MPMITVKLFASLTRYLPAGAVDNQAQLDLPEGETVGGVIRRLGLPREHCHLVLVNGGYIPPGERDTAVLASGDALAMWPPVAGG